MAASGIIFQLNPLVFIVTPHRCKSAFYCPHTIHDIFDHGGLAIAYNDTTKSNAFIRNNMQHIWKGRFMNTWAFGGDACNPIATPTLTTDSFVLEMPRWCNPSWAEIRTSSNAMYHNTVLYLLYCYFTRITNTKVMTTVCKGIQGARYAWRVFI